ncbi:MAG: hypothetical protein WC477_05855 [Patescibacteria group bacterium]
MSKKKNKAQIPSTEEGRAREAAAFLKIVTENAHAPAESNEIPDQDEVEKSLTAIYEGKPTKQWLNTLDRGKHATWLKAIIGTLVMLALLATGAWAGLFFFGTSHFKGNGVEIHIEGPNEITTGQESTFFINWFNVMREPLADVRFQVALPSDFVLTSVDPQPTSDPLVFHLGSQAVEGRGTIKITGMFTGAIGSKNTIQVITTYRPASFNSDFETLSSKDVSYAKSVLKGTISAPEKVIPGDVVKISYTIENFGSKDMQNVRVRFSLPDGFVPATSTQEQLDAKQVSIHTPSIGAGSSTTFVLTGSFVSHSGGNATMVAEAGFVRSDGNFASADHQEKTISVLAGDLDMNVIINGTQDDRSVKNGDIQHITMSYQNRSGETLENVVLILHAQLPDGSHATSTFLNWNQIDDQNKGTVSGNAIRYTSDQIDSLKSITANADGMIELSIPVKEHVLPSEDVPIRILLEADIDSVGGQRVNRVVKTQPITLRLQSDAAVESVARYATEEGAPIGSGPLPPIVGSSTTYNVLWHFTKTLHSIDRITVSAALPPAVTWVGQRDVGAGNVSYDQDKKLITWTINTVPAEVGDLSASFDITLHPAEADVGRFADLVGETRFEFTDQPSGESILRTSPSLSTDMSDDPIAGRKGVVRQP